MFPTDIRCGKIYVHLFSSVHIKCEECVLMANKFHKDRFGYNIIDLATNCKEAQNKTMQKSIDLWRGETEGMSSLDSHGVIIF